MMGIFPRRNVRRHVVRRGSMLATPRVYIVVAPPRLQLMLSCSTYSNVSIKWEKLRYSYTVTHTHTHTTQHTHKQSNTHAHTHTRTHARTHNTTHAQIIKHTRTYTCAHAHIGTHNTHTYTHTHTHEGTRTHTLQKKASRPISNRHVASRQKLELCSKSIKSHTYFRRI
jgi:hypothetical protein